MASYSSIKRECEVKNRARNVDEMSSYGIERFWNQAGNRRFLISGGTRSQREEALMYKILHDMKENTMPTIVLNSSAEFEALFRETLSGNPEADWIVFSDDNRDYHVGFGMSKENIKGFLYDRAIKTYQNLNDTFNNYLDAFLTVLEQYFPVSLPAMLHLAEYSDSEIAELGSKKGVSAGKVDLIRQNPEAGATLRNLLGDVFRAFRKLTTKDCESELSLLRVEWENDSVAMVRINSEYPEILNTYFVKELRQLKTKRRFRLILNGIPMEEEDAIRQLILELRSSSEIELGLCDEDILHILENEERLVSFPIQLIFLAQGNQGMTPEGQIKRLGDYYHYEPTRGGGKGAELVQLISSSDWGITHEARDRIRHEDYDGYEAVLKGTKGEKLLLVKHLK